MAYQEGELFGPYRLQSRLSGNRTVPTYLAEHMRLYSQVVIKIFPVHAHEDLLSIEHEARLLASLNHPNILSILDYGQQDDLFYIVTPYLPGGSLRQRYLRSKRIPLTTVVSYVKQLASALQYVHERGIVHRDVKPGNIFLRPDGQVVLADFGIATFVGEQDGIMGTPTYMAPEQFNGRAEPASDQYALGTVVYEWLGGQKPFYGLLTEIVDQKVSEKLAPLHTIAPNTPPEVEEVIMIALSSEPERRFRSVLAFANALEQASQSFRERPIGQLSSTQGLPPVSGRSSAPSEPASQSFRERPILSGLPPVSGRSSAPSEPASQLPWISFDSQQVFPQERPPMSSPGMSYGASPFPETEEEELNSRSLSGILISRPARRSSIFRRVGKTISSFLPGRKSTNRPQTELALFAIANTTLEQDERAIVGNTYTLQAGISQQRPEQFASEPFEISVQDPLQPVLFDVLVHPSENIKLIGPAYQSLPYQPDGAEPQLISWPFYVNTPGQSYLLINFYRERQWLKTLRFAFVGLESSAPSSVMGGS